MQLGAQQAALGVDGFCNALIESKALFGVERRAEAVPQHRHIADNDHCAAARGDGTIASD